MSYVIDCRLPTQPSFIVRSFRISRHAMRAIICTWSNFLIVNIIFDLLICFGYFNRILSSIEETFQLSRK